MRFKIIYYFLLIAPILVWSQQEFHVFTSTHKISPGLSSGNGSLKQPWDLQTALDQKEDVVNGGDTIWLHEGTYNGRFISKLKSTIREKQIIISAYKSDRVILNGNVPSDTSSILEIHGGQVTFKNLEITFIGRFSRDVKDPNFQNVGGINHLDGEDCHFINLKIHNTPGSGIGSWKRTGGSSIIGCTIFNNGYMSKVRGSGVGIYVQNQSDKTRLIKDNLIFNNYYKGVEVWSATSGSKFEFVKNVTLQNNIIFNNGLPAGVHVDNVIIASADRDGINVAKNIILENNILYHNSDFTSKKNFGDGASLTLGLNANAPIENVKVKDNIIVGKNNALRILYAKTLEFKNNIAYCGYVHFYSPVLEHLNSTNWKFSNNTYYSRTSNPFRISNHKDYALSTWQDEFKIDLNSQRKQVATFDLPPILKIIKSQEKTDHFKLALFNKQGENVMVDVSKYQIPIGKTYTIRDVENNESISKGILEASMKIQFKMGKLNKTAVNFGVYILEFDTDERLESDKKSFFKRLFGWLF